MLRFEEAFNKIPRTRVGQDTVYHHANIYIAIGFRIYPVNIFNSGEYYAAGMHTPSYGHDDMNYTGRI